MKGSANPSVEGSVYVSVIGTISKGRGGQFKDWIYAIALSADQQWLAMADISGIVQVWKFES